MVSQTLTPSQPRANEKPRAIRSHEAFLYFFDRLCYFSPRRAMKDKGRPSWGRASRSFLDPCRLRLIYLDDGALPAASLGRRFFGSVGPLLLIKKMSKMANFSHFMTGKGKILAFVIKMCYTTHQIEVGE